jgi:hypothetical protein
MDKETYEGVFLTTDWDEWCQQFIKGNRENVDSMESERDEGRRE